MAHSIDVIVEEDSTLRLDNYKRTVICPVHRRRSKTCKLSIDPDSHILSDVYGVNPSLQCIPLSSRGNSSSRTRPTSSPLRVPTSTPRNKTLRANKSLIITSCSPPTSPLGLSIIESIPNPSTNPNPCRSPPSQPSLVLHSTSLPSDYAALLPEAPRKPSVKVSKVPRQAPLPSTFPTSSPPKSPSMTVSPISKSPSPYPPPPALRSSPVSSPPVSSHSVKEFKRSGSREEPLEVMGSCPIRCSNTSFGRSGSSNNLFTGRRSSRISLTRAIENQRPISAVKGQHLDRPLKGSLSFMRVRSFTPVNRTPPPSPRVVSAELLKQ
ncbi:hypothetical protein P9112_005911 [Eukaryota sp. TZLM1-RC]